MTYSSDYFHELHDLAIQLIKDGGAYVCHQTAPEIKASRDLLRVYHGRGLPAHEKGPLPKGAASPYRNRSVEENLTEFRKMRTGMYDGSGKEFETRTTVTAVGSGRKSESGSSRSLRL